MIKTRLLSCLLLFAVNCNSPKMAVKKTDTVSESSKFNIKNEETILNLTGKTALDLNVAFKNFPSPEQLQILILDSLALKTIPTSISRFTQLKHLSLVSNPDLDFKQTFDILKKSPLEFLNLQKNKLTLLPENTSSLQFLTEINLAYNNLKDEKNYLILSKLTHLKEVWLDHNNLQETPKKIGCLTQITRLYLGHNQLESLPKELIKMKNLRVLHLEYNNFNTFSEVFLETPSLLLLHLNNNNIKEIPRSFESEKISLKGLILDNNPISSKEQTWIEKEFSDFFLLSFDQKK